MALSENSIAQFTTPFSDLILNITSKQCIFLIFKNGVVRPCLKHSTSYALRQQAIRLCWDIASDEDTDALSEAIAEVLAHCFCYIHENPRFKSLSLMNTISERWKRELTAKWKNATASYSRELKFRPQTSCLHLTVSISSDDDETSSIIATPDESPESRGSIPVKKNEPTNSVVSQRAVMADMETTTSDADLPVKIPPNWAALGLALLKDLGPKDLMKGKVYIAASEKLSGLVKVGWAQDVVKRLGGHQQHFGAEFKCLWQSDEPIVGAYRIEQLILAEFRGHRDRARRKCHSKSCTQFHREFIDKESESIIDTAKDWETWFDKGRPYTDGKLDDYWREKLHYLLQNNEMPTAKALTKIMTEKLDEEAQARAATSNADDLTNISSGKRSLRVTTSSLAPTTTTSTLSETSIGKRTQEYGSPTLTDLAEQSEADWYDCSTTLVGESELDVEDYASFKLSQKLFEVAASPILDMPGGFPRDSQEILEVVKQKDSRQTMLQVKQGVIKSNGMPLRPSAM